MVTKVKLIYPKKDRIRFRLRNEERPLVAEKIAHLLGLTMINLRSEDLARHYLVVTTEQSYHRMEPFLNHPTPLRGRWQTAAKELEIVRIYDQCGTKLWENVTQGILNGEITDGRPPPTPAANDRSAGRTP